MQSMIHFKEIESALSHLGARLRQARIRGGQSQALFAERIGVSVPTLRAMERGKPTAALGHWALALWALNALDDLASVLPERSSLLEQLQHQRPARERAKRRASRAA